MFTVFIGIEGFYTKLHGYIAKELTLSYMGSEWCHFLLAPPSGEVTETDRKTISWTTNHLNHLNWNEGILPYDNISNILMTVGHCHVVCHGSAARIFLKKHLAPTTKLTDMAELGHKLPSKLPKAPCGRNHGGRYCSMAKAFHLRDYAGAFGL